MESLLRFLQSLLGRFSPICIIQPDECGVKTLCGRIVHTCEPGVHWMLPLVHRMEIVNVTEQIPDIRCQSVITSDGKEFALSIGVAYEVKDPEKAIYHVVDADKALETLSLGVVFHYINTHTYAECAVAENIVTELRRNITDHAGRRWGLKILKVWVTDMGQHQLFRVLTNQPSGQFLPLRETDPG